MGTENVIASDLITIRGGTSWSDHIMIAGYRSGCDSPAAGHLSTHQAPEHSSIDMRNQITDQSQAGVYLSGGANHNRFLRLEIKDNINFGIVFSGNNGNAPFN
jgi:hypothetical protein